MIVVDLKIDNPVFNVFGMRKMKINLESSSVFMATDHRFKDVHFNYLNENHV